MIFVDRGRLHGGQSILPMGDWMTRAANKTTDAINDGPAHVVTDLYRDPNVKAALEKLFRAHKTSLASVVFAGDWPGKQHREKVGGTSVRVISAAHHLWANRLRLHDDLSCVAERHRFVRARTARCTGVEFCIRRRRRPVSHLA